MEVEEKEESLDNTPDPERSEGIKRVSITGGSRINPNQSIQQPIKKGINKKFILLGIVVLVVLATLVLFRHQLKGLVSGSVKLQPTPTPAPTLTPTPTPNPLTRADWSLEVLNGSGETGLAKKVADKIESLGYRIVKTGNADKSNYLITQILVKKELSDKIDLVIADLKDTIKIASVGGELKEGTASARIILGKDSI